MRRLVEAMYMHFRWFSLDYISITLASVIRIARVAAAARLLFQFLGVQGLGCERSVCFPCSCVFAVAVGFVFGGGCLVLSGFVAAV